MYSFPSNPPAHFQRRNPRPIWLRKAKVRRRDFLLQVQSQSRSNIVYMLQIRSGPSNGAAVRRGSVRSHGHPRRGMLGFVHPVQRVSRFSSVTGPFPSCLSKYTSNPGLQNAIDQVGCVCGWRFSVRPFLGFELLQNFRISYKNRVPCFFGPIGASMKAWRRFWATFELRHFVLLASKHSASVSIAPMLYFQCFSLLDKIWPDFKRARKPVPRCQSASQSGLLPFWLFWIFPGIPVRETLISFYFVGSRKCGESPA